MQVWARAIPLWQAPIGAVISLPDAACDGLAVLRLDRNDFAALSPMGQRIALRAAAKALRDRVEEAMKDAQTAAESRDAVLGVRLFSGATDS